VIDLSIMAHYYWMKLVSKYLMKFLQQLIDASKKKNIIPKINISRLIYLGNQVKSQRPDGEQFGVAEELLTTLPLLCRYLIIEFGTEVHPLKFNNLKFCEEIKC
jgi:hypothetical protein